jgi:hypothetical protein
MSMDHSAREWTTTPELAPLATAVMLRQVQLHSQLGLLSCQMDDDGSNYMND